MKKPQELALCDFKTITLVDGCERRTEIDISRANFQTLIEEHNNLVEVVNALLELSPPEYIAWDE